MAALQIQDRSPESRPVASLSQSQTQLTRPVATGLRMQRAPELICSANHMKPIYEFVVHTWVTLFKLLYILEVGPTGIGRFPIVEMSWSHKNWQRICESTKMGIPGIHTASHDKLQNNVITLSMVT